jgi:hypothetical protein
MKTGWWSFELPVYRPHPDPTTYSLFSYESLPPIRETLDPEYQWLRSQPVKERSLAGGGYSSGEKPDLGKLSAIAAQLDAVVPGSFTTFIASTELHERIRSCTDCYLDVADYAVRTKGTVEGYLIHFLSDSQWCVHWYLHVDHCGNDFVVASLDAYGFAAIATHESVEIDLAREAVWFCTPTFMEFIYRFWLENEIWFALAMSGRALTAVEQAYVDHYAAQGPAA